MAPNPYVYATSQEFLDGARSQRDAVGAFFSNRCADIASIVATSVAPNTFRAFHLRRFQLRPSALYRSWCSRWLAAELGSFRRLDAVDGMRAWMLRGAGALNADWLGHTNGEYQIGIGRAAKLLALSVKHLMWYTGFTPEERARLIPLLEVPLDRYTLQGVRQLLPQLCISPSASMGFVSDEATYAAIQDGIRGLCSGDVFPVHYEFAAWNAAHADVPVVQPRCAACRPGTPCYR